MDPADLVVVVVVIYGSATSRIHSRPKMLGLSLIVSKKNVTTYIFLCVIFQVFLTH